MEVLTEAQWDERLQTIDDIAVANMFKGKRKYYLFLDFDGVINIWSKDKYMSSQIKSINDDRCQFADIPSVKRLSDLCLQHNMNIVISSSWRFAGEAYCAAYLKKCGLKKGVKVCGITAQDFEERQKHITDYLLEHPDFTGYMILDDLYLPYLKDNLIKCETLEGFDEAKAQQATLMIKQMEVRTNAVRYQQYARQNLICFGE